MVAPVGSGTAASEVSGSATPTVPGVSRTTVHPLAHRSVSDSASGAFSRLPFSSATAASHSSERGGRKSTVAVQATIRPPLSLLRTVTSARPPSVSPSGSGCSPGPPPTSSAAPSCQMCHTARACSVPRTQTSPDFFVASSTRALSSRSAASVMGASLDRPRPGARAQSQPLRLRMRWMEKQTAPMTPSTIG